MKASTKDRTGRVERLKGTARLRIGKGMGEVGEAKLTAARGKRLRPRDRCLGPSFLSCKQHSVVTQRRPSVRICGIYEL